MTRMTSLRRVASRWRRIALRALGGLALSVLVVTAVAALLDPPAAEAGGLPADPSPRKNPRPAGLASTPSQPARASPERPGAAGAGSEGPGAAGAGSEAPGSAVARLAAVVSAAPAARGRPGSRPSGTGPRELSGLWSPCPRPGAVVGVLNLNTANQSELESLPGIGPAKARRILDWRARHGAFHRIRDLRRVRGFGRKTVLHLARYLRLEGPTTLQGGGAH